MGGLLILVGPSTVPSVGAESDSHDKQQSNLLPRGSASFLAAHNEDGWGEGGREGGENEVSL